MDGGDGGSPTRDLGVRSASLYASELRPQTEKGRSRRLHPYKSDYYIFLSR
jgi:hypothetical protein